MCPSLPRFRRTGRAPRVILGYRCETDLRKLSVEIGGGDKVELLAGGAPFTGRRLCSAEK